MEVGVRLFLEGSYDQALPMTTSCGLETLTQEIQDHEEDRKNLAIERLIKRLDHFLYIVATVMPAFLSTYFSRVPNLFLPVYSWSL